MLPSWVWPCPVGPAGDIQQRKQQRQNRRPARLRLRPGRSPVGRSKGHTTPASSPAAPVGSCLSRLGETSGQPQVCSGHHHRTDRQAVGDGIGGGKTPLVSRLPLKHGGSPSCLPRAEATRPSPRSPLPPRQPPCTRPRGPSCSVPASETELGAPGPLASSGLLVRRGRTRLAERFILAFPAESLHAPQISPVNPVSTSRRSGNFSEDRTGSVTSCAKSETRE